MYKCIKIAPCFCARCFFYVLDDCRRYINEINDNTVNRALATAATIEMMEMTATTFVFF